MWRETSLKLLNFTKSWQLKDILLHRYVRVSYRIFAGGGGGGREVYWVPNFCLPCPLLAHYAANAKLTSWKIAPGVHGVLDKVIYLGEDDSMLHEYGNDQLQVLVNFYVRKKQW